MIVDKGKVNDFRPKSVIIHLSISLDLFFDSNHRLPVIETTAGTDAVRQLFVRAVRTSGQLDAVQRVVRAPFAAAGL